MYAPTEAQLAAEKRLEKKGFSFSNWLPHEPDGEGQPVEGTEHLGTMMMVKRTHRFSKEWREIEPDGSIN